MKIKKEHSTNRIRHLIYRQYLIFPSIQLKYSFIYAGFSIAVMIIFNIGLFYFVNQLTESGLSKNEIEALKISLMKYSFGISAVTTLFMFILTILITHRFLGPFFAIKRALDKYKTEKQFSKISIRSTDEAKLLVNNINDFFTHWKGPNDDKK